jgi:hypothetical protein
MPEGDQAITGGFMEQDLYIPPVEVERITGRKLQTLANERYRGCGIPYYKVGGSIRYKLADVISFMERHRVDPEAQVAGSCGGAR